MDHGSGRARRRARRRPRFGRFLWLTAIGTLIPGLGLLAGGRRGWGKFFLALVVLGVLGAGLVLWQMPRNRLAMTAFDRDQLIIIAFGLAAVAIVWLIVALTSHRAVEPDGLSGGKRFAGAVVLILTASLVLSPLAIGARYAWTQHDLIGAMSRDSSTTPEIEKSDPWADMPRVNILLMGSDAGPNRDGTRPDTLILTSIDTETGEATMFSLPRQLANVPFPEGHALTTQFPFGFQPSSGPDWRDSNFWLNAVYTYATEEMDEAAFPGSEDPGADATKLAVSGALGLDVHYYVMADLQGFEEIVDAMDGLTIDVPYPIPIATEKIEGGGCTPAKDWILPGEDQHLDGYRALWFGRARCAPDHPEYAALYQELGGNPVTSDHNRMERQRCVMGAIAGRADPMTLLANFESLAAATEDNVTTDIPTDLWPELAKLGLEVKDATISSLAFNNKVLDGGIAGGTGDPNYEEIHRLVQEALGPPAEVDPTAAPSDEPTDDGEDGSGGSEGDEGADDGSTDENEDDDTGPAPVDVSAAC